MPDFRFENEFEMKNETTNYELNNNYWNTQNIRKPKFM